MRVSKLILGGVFLIALLASASYASTIVTPALEPVPVSFAFGPVEAGGQVTDQYSDYGIVFSDGVATAIFDDPPLAFAGVNTGGILDLASPVNGYFVVPGTFDLATTDSLSVEAGIADAVGNLLLEVFDINHVLLGSIVNDDPISGTLGPHFSNLLTLNIQGIAYFSVSTSNNDLFGVDQLEFNAPVAAGPAAIPEPSTLMLLGIGIVGLAGSRLGRRMIRYPRDR